MLTMLGRGHSGGLDLASHRASSCSKYPSVLTSKFVCHMCAIPYKEMAHGTCCDMACAMAQGLARNTYNQIYAMSCVNVRFPVCHVAPKDVCKSVCHGHMAHDCDMAQENYPF